MRKPIIAANWKMNKTHTEVVEFVNNFKEIYKESDKVDAVIGAPAIYLKDLVDAFEGTNVKVAAENSHFEDEGAFTGETSPKALKSIGVDYVILGHSERRDLFGETNEIVSQKAQAAYKNELTPIVCIGESLDVRENNQTQDYINQQVEESLKGITQEQAKNLVLAYEPVWAIGTGKTATPEQAEETCGWIREKLASLFDQDTADNICIQYGGSVKPANVAELMGQANIDGALVGGASLEADSFNQLLTY